MLMATRLLPAHKVARRVAARAFNAVEVDSPFRPSAHRLAANRGQGNAGRGVPDLFGFVDTRECFPAGAPVVIEALLIEIDR